MLNELDKELKKRGLNFVRYADDCIILVGSEKSANRVMENITKFIENKLGLKVNVTKSRVDKPNKIKYLGFEFFYDVRDKRYKAKPHQKSVDRIKAKIKELTLRKWSVSMDYRIMRLNQVIRGWINYYRIGQMKTICKEIDEHMRFRLRICIWKQWKKTGKRYKSLIKLGVPKSKAW